MRVTAGLRVLAVQPLWRRWTLASFLARLPTTMTLLALVLAGERASGSLAVGASLAGVATFIAGLAATVRGRQLDRRELRGGLQRACASAAGVIALEALALVVGAPLWVLFALAAAQGLAVAAVSGGYRALLVAAVPPEDLERANVMEAVFVEVAFVAGPALAGVLALVVGPIGVLVAMAAAIGAAALVTGRLPALEPQRQRAAAAPWRTPGARSVYLLAFTLGACAGVFESALPARTAELGLAPALAGPLLALTAIGSAAGGLVASGQRDGLGRYLWRAAGLVAAFGVLLVPVGLLDSLVALSVVLVLAGVPIAPLNALGARLLQGAVPAGRQAEGFAVYVAAILLGAGVGQALTGQLLDELGAQWLLVACAALPLAAGVILSAKAATAAKASGGNPQPASR